MDGFIAVLSGLRAVGHRGESRGNRGGTSRANCLHRSRHLRVEPLEDRTLLSVSGVGNDNAVSSLSLPTNANATALVQAMPSVASGANYGQLSVHLQPGTFSFAALPSGETSLSASGLDDASGDTGSPQLPGKLLRIALPIDARLDSVTLTVSSEQQATAIAGSYQLTPTPAAAADTDTGVVYATEGLQLVDGKNPLVYSANAYYDSQSCTFIDAQQMGRWKIAEVYYSPFEYNPVTGSVCVTEDTTIALNYKTDDPLPADLAGRTTWDAEAAGLVVNYNDASLGYAAAIGADDVPGGSATANYVIITTSAIQSHSAQLANFVAHKQALGYTVAVETESAWGGGTGDAAAEHIRTWLKNNYASMGIQYVLLVGNPDPSAGDVPMKMTWPRSTATSDQQSPTDYYYSDLTSVWDANGNGKFGEWPSDLSSKPLHEVLVGRIPVYNAQYSTLDSILTKTINYENASNISWRQNMLLPMGISNYANEDGGGDARCDGHTLGDYIKSDLATPNGYGSYTMYEKSGLTPVTATCNAPITESAVVSQWSTNPYGIVDWWGHGDDTGAYRKYWSADSDGDGVPDGAEMYWTNFFNSSDATSLNNSQPSVVVQVSCDNGAPEDTSNLGYALLKNGAIGTFSASRVSWYDVTSWYPSLGTIYGDNASYAYYITQKLVQSPTTESLGAALQWCRESLGTGFGAESWMNCTDTNLYGDPSLIPFKPGVSTEIDGTVYNDANGNGVRDTGETGQSGRTVFIDSNNNGILDSGTTTVSSGNVNLPIPDVSMITSNMPVSGIGGAITDVNVTLNINHTWDHDLEVYLISPAGTRVQLFANVGDSGHNFTGTILDDQAAVSITSGSAPFAGSYQPQTPLAALNGQSPNGTWSLEVHDDDAGDTGTLINWSLAIGAQEQYTVTNSTGAYALTSLAAGTYTIRQVQQGGWTQTAPAAGYYSVTVATGNVITGKDFGNFLDTTPPSVTINQAATQPDPTHASPINFSVVFSKSVTDFAAGDVSFAGSTATGTLVATVTGSGTTYNVAVTGMTGSGSVIAGIPAGNVHDSSGNVNTASTSTDNTVTYDVTYPTVTSSTPSTAGPTNASSLTFTMLFSEPVVNVSTDDFRLTATGTAAGTIASVSGSSGTSFTVTVNSIVGDGTLRLDLKSFTNVQDLAGNVAVSYAAGSTVTIDQTNPTVTSSTPSTAGPTNASSLTFTVAFGESVVNVSTDDFQLTPTGTAAGTIANVSASSGTSFTVTVNSIAGDGTLRLDLKSFTNVQDTAGNVAIGYTAGSIVTIDKTNPTVTSSTPSTAGPTNATSLTFTVAFSEPVVNVSTTDFRLTATGTAAGTIASVSASSGTSFTVTINSIAGDGTLRLDLKSFTTVQDLAGNVAISYSAGSTVTIDNTAPTVTGVLVASTAWQSAFLASLGGVGYAIPSGSNQVLSLPWGNLNEIIVQFSENVSVAQANMALVGVNVPNYTFAPSSFVYDSVAHRATWTVSQNLGVDKLLIDLDGSTAGAVADAAGNRLDGEWTNPTWAPPAAPVGGQAWPSGDGTPGGNFLFRFNVLPGDADQNGVVNFGDLNAVLMHYNQTGDWTTGDFTGDGVTNFADLSTMLSDYNQTLPAAEPTPPSGSGFAAIASPLAQPAIAPQANVATASTATAVWDAALVDVSLQLEQAVSVRSEV